MLRHLSLGQHKSVKPIDPRGELLDLLRENYLKRPDEMLMICPYGIGDILFACGFVEQLMQKRGRKHLTVLCKDYEKFIPSKFNKDYLAYTLPDWVDLRLLKESGPLPDNILYGHFQTNESTNLLGYKGVTLLDAYRARFDLPLNAPLILPQLVTAENRKKIQQYLASHALTPQKTVFLAPEANSVEELEVKLWHGIATKLKTQGWQIILNSDKFKDHIPHDVLYGILGLENIPALVEQVGLVIALRSGLCDLISGTRTKLIVLYPKTIWHGGSMLDATGLQAMGLSETATELEIESDTDSVIKQVFRSI